MDLNALRAIAILGVVLFHYKATLFAGGFAGVDVFFVISGYLMSKIISTGINNNKFSFVEYFEKRVKRILPALLLLVLILTILCFFFYLPQDYKENEKNATASILFLANVFYWKSANSYFAVSSDTNMFLHTWSLSVEWQFYCIFPFILVFLNKLFTNKYKLLIFLFSITTLICFLSIGFTLYKPNASFYLLPTRSWEMLCGSIAFFSEDIIKGYKWRKVAALIGYCAIALCFVFLKVSMPWPGVHTILPVVSTLLVVVSNCNEIKFIKYGFVQLIGKMSYSLYLWHWPVYVIAQYIGIQLDFKSFLLMATISGILGYVSYKYIENFKVNNWLNIISATTALATVTIALSYYNANSKVFKIKTLEIANYPSAHKKDIDKQFSRGICFIEPGNENFNKEKCLCIDDKKRNILLIGDSHAAMLSESLKEKLDNKKFNILQATVGGVLPTVTKADDNNIDLRKLIDYMYNDFIPSNAKQIEIVIITAHWAGKKDLKQKDILNGLKTTIEYFNKHNIKAIIIGQSESYRIPYSSIAARSYEYDKKVSIEYLMKADYSIDAYLKHNLGDYYIKIINDKSFPPLSANYAPYIWDGNHVSKYGADLIVNKFLSDSLAAKLLK